MIYTITKSENGHEISAHLQGKPYLAGSSHPNFETIRDILLSDQDDAEDALIGLFNIAFTAGQKFDRVSDRITYSSNNLYFDGEVVHGALVDAVIRAIKDGTTDFKPLALFFEKVVDNPNEHSKENLYRWLANKSFEIAEDGDILGWKGVRYSDGQYLSTTAGDAFADGVFYKQSFIPHVPGTIVEMVRGDVHWDPQVGCAAGLHVGVFNFASSYGNCMLQVKINPRDVVSVPTESSDQKMRVCRYFIVSEVDRYSKGLISRVTIPDDDEDFEVGGEDEFEADGTPVGQVDHWLERLLAEEEEIERRAAETQQDTEATATDGQIKCSECGTSFTPKNAKNIYCKKQCRWAGDRKAKKAEAKAAVKQGRKK